MVERFNRFSYAIFEISRCWHRLAADEMEKYGLKGPHAIYLLAMQRHPGSITAAQLCEVTGRDKADVSRAVSLLEQKGLICRENANAYRAGLLLTEQGKLAAAHVSRRASVAVELAGKDISDTDREIFYQALFSITANLQSLSKEGLPE